MIAKADVLVENFAPGTLKRLGLGWEEAHNCNPRLIYASGSGFGSDGPYRDYPAMDLTVQAISGVMSITGTPNGPPLKAGPAICDFFGGIHLYSAITTALFERERTQLGRAVEVSMMEAVYASLSSSLGLFYGSENKLPMRTGNRHGGLSLCPYNVYPASVVVMNSIQTLAACSLTGFTERNCSTRRSIICCWARPSSLGS
jgi:formyl-CoA transferase